MKKVANDFSVNAAEESSGFLLWQVTTLWQRGIKKALDGIDLTHPQFVILASLLWLSKQKDSITQIDLSVHSKIDPMTTSTIIRTLQRKQLVNRQEHHSDTRAKTITLTPEGAAATKRAVGLIEQFDADFFAALETKKSSFNQELLTLLKAHAK
ncbi:MarR family transcriptional regulator [Hymenobacter sp. BT18]|uniref:MarR family winged helix-turn-helix transcriptional regulator n=1 Tax=Hymenobacter sp. BT18 TaxID=2835648 RepID=UPI00143EB043|nr:MarR family transcriptional regulator [Hymenobacter sp. BT18]QIX62311.1 MarR family transcriptional regulator [Hymenobacter sp. BT18]